MSGTYFDEEFEQTLTEIFEAKPDLTEDEQNYIDVWVSKLREIEEDEGKPLRHEYIKCMKYQLEREPRRLSLPFTNMPPDSSLPPLQTLLAKDKSGPPSTPVPDRSRYLCSAGAKKAPCRPKGGSLKKPERPRAKSTKNEFENAEEMAICIAKSKGMMLAEFVADISRHTADKGHELRVALKVETSYFSEYVEKVITQRIKDVGDLLDAKQANEMMKIRKDYEKWQAELSICKKRLKEIVPEFDIDAYRRDRNYFKKIFSVDSSNPPGEDKLKEWKDENCHRLMWFLNEISKLTDENDQILEKISAMKSKALELERKETKKHKCHNQQIQLQSKENKELKQKSDKLAMDITDLLVSLEN